MSGGDTPRSEPCEAFAAHGYVGRELLVTRPVNCLSTERVPDGMKVDREGNVYCGGSGGLWIISPAGKKLGVIQHGFDSTTNLAFGGDMIGVTIVAIQRDA